MASVDRDCLYKPTSENNCYDLKIKTIILLLPVLIVFAYISLLSLLYMPTFPWFPWDHLGAWDHLGPGLRSTNILSGLQWSETHRPVYQSKAHEKTNS